MLVERSRDYVEPAIAGEIGKGRGAEEAGLQMVVLRELAVRGVEARMGSPRVAGIRERRVDAHGEAGRTGAVQVPDVEVLSRGGDDLRLVVAVDVADRRNAKRFPRRRQRGINGMGQRQPDPVGPHRAPAVEALHRGAVAVQGVELAARGGEQNIELVVAVDVVKARSRLAARPGDVPGRGGSRAQRPWPAGEGPVVAVGEERLPVAADVRRVGRFVDGQADLEGVALGVGVRVGVGGPGAVGGRTRGPPGVVRHLTVAVVGEAGEQRLRERPQDAVDGTGPVGPRNVLEARIVRVLAAGVLDRPSPHFPRVRGRRATPNREARRGHPADVDRREPIRRVELRLRRDAGAPGSAAPARGDRLARPQLDPRHRRRHVDPAVAEVRVPARGGLVGQADRAGVRGQDVLGGHGQELAGLVAAQPSRERAAGERGASVRLQEAGDARRLAGVLGARRAHQHDVGLAPVLGQVGVAKEAGGEGLRAGGDADPGQALQELLAALLEFLRRCGRIPEPGQATRPRAGAVGRRVRVGAGDIDGLVVVRRVVVVGAVDVARDEHQRHALAVGVAHGAAREPCVGQAADRPLGHGGAVVDGVGHGERPVVGGGDERVPDPQRHQLAPRAKPRLVGRVVGLGQRLQGAPGPVAAGATAARRVVGVVVVVEEVPAGDVVDVAVGVAIGSLREGGDQVGGVEDCVGVRARVRGVVASAVRNPRVRGVVGDVEGAVAVAVVDGAGRRVGALRQRQLAPVQADLVRQLLLLPANPGVEDGDRHGRDPG